MSILCRHNFEKTLEYNDFCVLNISVVMCSVINKCKMKEATGGKCALKYFIG